MTSFAQQSSRTYVRTAPPGREGSLLRLNDANLATTLDVDLDQLNRVLASLMEVGVVRGRAASTVTTTGVRAEWDYLRLAEDPLPGLR